MNKSVVVLVLACILAPVAALGQPAAKPLVPSDAEIRRILTERIDTHKQSVGMVVGVIEPQGRRVIAYGHLDQGDPRPVDGDTLFEIGSVTKVFTSLLLEEAVHRGEVALNDPLEKYLPAGVQVPERKGRKITLVDLATHTSGLPREATNLQPANWSDPERDYSLQKLYDFLSSYQLKRDIGSQFEYSNLGVSLLGIALARQSSLDYESLVKSRILGPLGMNSTTISLTPELEARFSTGHGYAMYSVAHTDLRIFAGAGSLRSTANDLLEFLAANLGYRDTPLAPDMAAMLEVHRSMVPAPARLLIRGYQIRLGWLSSRQKGVEMIWHNGATPGFTSFVGFDPKASVGVVVLSNGRDGPGVDDIGMHLLNPKVPLLSDKELKLSVRREEVAIDPSLLDRYAGRYQFPEQKATVTREGSHLVLKGDRDTPDKFYPEDERNFFSKIQDIQLSFQVDAQGRVTGFVFNHAGKKDQIQRIE